MDTAEVPHERKKTPTAKKGRRAAWALVVALVLLVSMCVATSDSRHALRLAQAAGVCDVREYGKNSRSEFTSRLFSSSAYWRADMDAESWTKFIDCCQLPESTKREVFDAEHQLLGVGKVRDNPRASGFVYTYESMPWFTPQIERKGVRYSFSVPGTALYGEIIWNEAEEVVFVTVSYS